MELRTGLDDPDLVARLDPSGMLNAIDRFPDPLGVGTYRSETELSKGKSQFRSLVLMGMGGSASAGDLILDWLRGELRVPGIVHREPSLPAFVDSKTLFVAISYSGETTETLAAVKAAKARRAKLIGVGTGGKLANLCEQYRAPFLRVETAVAPRAALTQLAVATSLALESLGIVSPISLELKRTYRELLPLRNQFRASSSLERNPAKRLALKLQGHFLVLYSLQRMSSVARRFKNQLAENSKEVAKYESLPESCHNEIEAWRNSPNHSLPILIRDSKESSLETPIIEAFRSTLASVSDAHPVNVQVPSRGALSRLLCPILFLDYVSVYLALLKRVDPTPTKLIARYKAALKH